MRLTDIRIDAFGVLSGYGLSDLGPGLNVFYGSNGAGKTSVVRFLRGLWSGFDEARGLKLLPPLAAGQPGGSCGVLQGVHRGRVIRQALPNATDRLAVSIQQGDVDETASLRGQIDALQPAIAKYLFTPSGEETHSLEELLAAVAADGIDLASRLAPATHLAAKIEELRLRRERLSGDDEDSINAHLAACDAALAEIASLQREAADLRDRLSRELPTVECEIDQLAGRIEWLDLEVQAIETDLSELENRTVSQPMIRNDSLALSHRASREVAEHRLRHVALVLEDLALERLHVSMAAAERLGAEETVLSTIDDYRLRAEIDRCETELLLHAARLRARLATSAPAPVRIAAPVRDESRHASLCEQRSHLRTELDETRAAWRSALDVHDGWDVECSRLIVLEQRIAERGIDIETRRLQISELQDELQSLQLAEEGLRRVQSGSQQPQPAPVLREASRLLAEMTEGRYRDLFTERSRTTRLTVRNDSGLTLPLSSLSRGTLDQVALCVRIALVEEYARRGLHLPLVLDDVLSDSDGDRLLAAVRALHDLGDSHQVLFFTCQERVAEAFETLGETVQLLPGSRGRVARVVTTVATPGLATLSVAVESLPINDTAPFEEVEDRAERVQPSEPHWLRVDSPLTQIPSLGEQMSRRLGSIGVRSIAELIELDVESSPVPVDSLQIRLSQLRIWQAEARLLSCVPDLTGRDAQLLAAVGILSPLELAQSDADHLVRRIDRLRGDRRSGWVATGLVWPDRRVVIDWIEQGRRARTFAEACEAAGRTAPPASTPPEDRPRRRFDRAHGTRRSHSHRPRFAAGSRRTPFARLERRPLQDQQSGAISQPQLEAPHPVSFIADTSSPVIAPASRPRFHLQLDSAVEQAPSIGPTTARRLQNVGIVTVADLLARDADQVAEKLQHRRINADAVRLWQAQARLVCRVPELRGHDAQVLVACGITDPEAVAAMSPQTLFNVVGPFVATKDGQRLLRSAKSPDLAEITDWIRWAQNARTLKAA